MIALSCLITCAIGLVPNINLINVVVANDRERQKSGMKISPTKTHSTPRAEKVSL